MRLSAEQVCYWLWRDSLLVADEGDVLSALLVWARHDLASRTQA